MHFAIPNSCRWLAIPALAAIAAGDSSHARSATAQALRVGHTSGTDTMIGAILGAAIWQKGNEADQVLSALSCDLLSSAEPT